MLATLIMHNARPSFLAITNTFVSFNPPIRLNFFSGSNKPKALDLTSVHTLFSNGEH